MILHAPQIIYIVLVGIGFGVAVSEHGKPKEGKNNAWNTIIAQAIGVGLLYWGGFFG